MTPVRPSASLKSDASDEHDADSLPNHRTCDDLYAKRPPQLQGESRTLTLIYKHSPKFDYSRCDVLLDLFFELSVPNRSQPRCAWKKAAIRHRASIVAGSL